MIKIIGFIVSCTIALAVAVGGYELYFKKPSASASVKTFRIAEGMSSGEVARLLKEASVISSQSLFTFFAGFKGASSFHAGTFKVKEGMSASDALKVLTRLARAEVDVTIPEGLNLREVASRLTQAGLLKRPEDLYEMTGKPVGASPFNQVLVKKYPFLASVPKSASLEGYLFPETYRFYADASVEEIVGKMLDTWHERTADLFASHPASGRTAHEVLTIASILEKEVTSEADRAKVTDLMNRRLEKGMALQMDSTVNYAADKKNSSSTLADLAVDSRYNTYLYRGLPPGPIANPSLVSIRAALSPTPNPYWFFLTTTDGKVIYSKTLEEHGAAKRKYLN